VIVPHVVADTARLYCDHVGCTAQLEARTAQHVRDIAVYRGWRVGPPDLCTQHHPATREAR
jgi:hypothetical protein